MNEPLDQPNAVWINFFCFGKKEYLSYDCVLFIQNESQKLNKKTTFNGGSLGSCIDEERSQLRYVMWIAEISESSNFWTQIALLGYPGSMSAWVSRKPKIDKRFSLLKSQCQKWALNLDIITFVIIGEFQALNLRNLHLIWNLIFETGVIFVCNLLLL